MPEPAPNGRVIRGHRLRNILQAIATGDQTYAQVADDFGTTEGNIQQYAFYYKVEVAEMRAQSEEPYPGCWTYERINRVAAREQWLADIEEQLSNPDLSPTHRNRLIATGDRLLISLTDDYGQLVSRQRVEAEITQAELPPVGSKWILDTDSKTPEAS